MNNQSQTKQKPPQIKTVKRGGGSRKELTLKQEKFCREYLLCMNASEAYRRSFDCSKMKEETINRSAFELKQNPKITARIAALKDNIEELCGISKQTQINGLKAIVDANPGSPESVKAFAEINKMMPGYLASSKLDLQNLGKDGKPADPLGLASWQIIPTTRDDPES